MTYTKVRKITEDPEATARDNALAAIRSNLQNLSTPAEPKPDGE